MFSDVGLTLVSSLSLQVANHSVIIIDAMMTTTDQNPNLRRDNAGLDCILKDCISSEQSRIREDCGPVRQPDIHRNAGDDGDDARTLSRANRNIVGTFEFHAFDTREGRRGFGLNSFQRDRRTGCSAAVFPNGGVTALFIGGVKQPGASWRYERCCKLQVVQGMFPFKSETLSLTPSPKQRDSIEDPFSA